MSVSEKILEQLGGVNRLAAMTNASNFLAGENYVSFKLGTGAKNKINLVRITLGSDDLYQVEFMRLWGAKLKPISEHNGIYGNMLQELFVRETGFYLKLAPGDQKVFGR